MEIKDYVKQFRDLQKSHKKVRVVDFCRENMLDYYEMVEALKQEKFGKNDSFKTVFTEQLRIRTCFTMPTLLQLNAVSC